MKKLKYIILSAVLLAQICTLTSCVDWLDLKPTDGVPREEYWKTKEDVNSALVGAYLSMTDGNLITRMFLYGEWRADMIQSSTRRKNANVQSVIEGEISAENSLLDWYPFYRTINLCNTLLKYAPQAQSNDPSFSPKLLKEYEAQAIAIRSLMYFYLVRSFGDVPLSVDAYVDSSQPMSLPKTSQEIILDTLVANLTYAEKHIPYKYSNTDIARNKGKITAWAVKSLLADVYLWKEEYEKSVALCNEIINSGQQALIPVSREMHVSEGDTEAENDTIYYPNESDCYNLFNTTYYKGNSIESIFEIQFSKEGLNPFYGLMSASNGYLMAKIEILMDEIFIPTAKSDRNYYDIRETLCEKQGYIWKYIGKEPNGAERDQAEYSANYIVYRLAEVYLIKAEALTQMGIMANNDQGYLKEARAALEKVRVRANAVEATDLTYKQTELDGKTMEEFVLEERARELAFEGKRWFDVLRQAKRDNYAGNNLKYLMDLAVSSAPASKVFSLQTKYRNINSHYLPIYSLELDANPKLVQNEFYSNN